MLLVEKGKKPADVEIFVRFATRDTGSDTRALDKFII